MEVEPP